MLRHGGGLDYEHCVLTIAALARWWYLARWTCRYPGDKKVNLSLSSGQKGHLLIIPGIKGQLIIISPSADISLPNMSHPLNANSRTQHPLVRSVWQDYSSTKWFQFQLDWIRKLAKVWSVCWYIHLIEFGKIMFSVFGSIWLDETTCHLQKYDHNRFSDQFAQASRSKRPL